MATNVNFAEFQIMLSATGCRTNHSIYAMILSFTGANEKESKHLKSFSLLHTLTKTAPTMIIPTLPPFASAVITAWMHPTELCTGANPAPVNGVFPKHKKHTNNTQITH
ncbi:MAG: hypothetical protein ACE5D0_10030 [Fidelibacterota bacterium]